MSASSGRTLRFVSGAAALVVFTFVLPLVQPGALKANDVLYTVRDLGALNCCYSWSAASAALALNAHGDVAGLTSSPSDSQRQVPFVYHNGTMTMISDTYGWAAGINDARQVTGVFTPPGLLGSHAFVYQDGVFTDIGTLPGYSNQPYALPYAINNSGTIVGDDVDRKTTLRTHRLRHQRSWRRRRLDRDGQGRRAAERSCISLQRQLAQGY